MEQIQHRLIVAALVQREDESLLVQQQGPDNPQPFWALPGGVVEAGEAVRAALAREVKEETGLAVCRAGDLLYTLWADHGNGRRTSALIFRIESWDGTLAPNDPDGFIKDVAFLPRATALDRLQTIPYARMREPLLAALSGAVPAQALWYYPNPTADPCVRPATELDPWRDPGYLAAGTDRQRQALATLTDLALFDRLHQFEPLLIGTVPLDVDTRESDLDLACWAPDLEEFTSHVRTQYGDLPFYREKRIGKRGVESAVIAFRSGCFDIEIFAQPLPLIAQYGVRHMLIEDRLLRLGGADARRSVRQMKAEGIKTEPAFARYFGLEGDAYETLWQLSFADDATLRRRVRNKRG